MTSVKPRKGNNMLPEKDDDEYIDRGDLVDDDVDELDDDETSTDEDEPEEEPDQEEDDSEEEEDSDDEESEDDEDSDEDEDDDEDEDSEDDTEDEDEEDTAGNQRIPRSRLNQVIQQREAEKERSAWLEEQLEVLIKQRQAPAEPDEPEVVVPDYDFDGAEDKYGDLILEGSVKEASALRREISSEQGKLFEAQIAQVRSEAAAEAVKTSKASVEDNALESYLSDITADKPYLDDASDDYNERAVKMANSLMVSYVAEGYTKVEALALAVSDIDPLFDTPEDTKTKLGSKKTPSARDKKARRKSTKASEQQPPDTQRRSGRKVINLDEIDIGKMTDKAFNSLTKKERAVLRGD